MCEKKGGRENAPKRRRKKIISSILAVVVFAVMFIMAARDKLSRPAVMGMSAVGAVLLLFGMFIGLSRSDDQMLIAQIAAVLIFVVMFVLIIMDKIERHIVTLCCGLATLVMVFGICLRSFDAEHREHLHAWLLVHSRRFRGKLQRYQLGDHHLYRRNDDNGRGHG